jgi:hypothetical protein
VVPTWSLPCTLYTCSETSTSSAVSSLFYQTSWTCEVAIAFTRLDPVKLYSLGNNTWWNISTATNHRRRHGTTHYHCKCCCITPNMHCSIIQRFWVCADAKGHHFEQLLL